jgi:ribosome biogenesis GTPase A
MASFASNLHWYPGHMAKGTRQISENVKHSDVIIMVGDSRAPYTSLNLDLLELVKHKPHLFVLSHADLASESALQKAINYYEKNNLRTLGLNLLGNQAPLTIRKELQKLAIPKREKEISKNINPQPLKVLIVGVPNTGKSTLINKLVGYHHTKTGNRPGVTRTSSLVKIDAEFFIFDSPGVLVKSFTNDEEAIKLALVNALPIDILPLDKIATYLYTFLVTSHLAVFQQLINLKAEDLESFDTFLSAFAKKRGFLLKGTVDLERAAREFIKLFQDGCFKKISLE